MGRLHRLLCEEGHGVWGRSPWGGRKDTTVGVGASSDGGLDQALGSGDGGIGA